MSISRHDIPFTYEDYKTLSASTDERYELIDGDLYMAPAPSIVHQAVSMNLIRRLDGHVREAGCGRVFHAPVDVVLGEGAGRSVVQPDILFISNERERIMRSDEVVGAPDLVIEILSPSTADRDMSVKKALYARSGVLEYWLVDPRYQRIEVFQLESGRYSRSLIRGSGDEVVSEVVPGFRIPVGDVFSDLPGGG